MSNSRPRGAACTAASCILAFATLASAHPTGTVFSSAVDGDGASLVWNPAAMSLVTTSRFDFVGNLSIPSATYQRAGIDTAQTNAPFPSVSLATVRPEPVLGLVIDRLWKKRLRLGITVSVPYAGGASWPETLKYQGQTILGPTRYQITDGLIFDIFTQVGASILVHPTFAIGFSLNIVASSISASKDLDLANQGAIRNTLPCAQNPLGCENPTLSTPLKISGSGASVGASFGILWKPIPIVRVGVGYITPTKVPLSATLSIDAGKLESFARQFLPSFGTIPINGSGSASLTVPQRLHVAIAVDVHPRIELMAQLRWINYSATEIISGAITQKSSNILPNALAIPGVRNDEWGGIVRIVGHIKERTRLAFSLEYTSSTVPDAYMTPNNLDFTAVTFNLGANVRVSRIVWLGASFSQVLYIPRNITKSAFSSESAEPYNLPDPSGTYVANSERVGLDVSVRF